MKNINHRNIGVKIDIAGVLVSDEEFAKADRYLLERGYLTPKQQEAYQAMHKAATKEGRWKEFIDYKIGLINELAGTKPSQLEEAYRHALGEGFVNRVRGALDYYREKTGKDVALHSSMSEDVNNIFKDLIGANLVVKKFAPAPGISIDDFDATRKREFLAGYAQKHGIEGGIKLGDYMRFGKFPSIEEAKKAKNEGRIMRYHGRPILENWIDIDNPTLPDVIKSLADKQQKKAGQKGEPLLSIFLLL